MYLPDWIQEHKEPRTEIKRIKTKLYSLPIKAFSAQTILSGWNKNIYPVSFRCNEIIP